MFNDESRFQLCSDDQRRRAWRRPEQCEDFAFTISRHRDSQPARSPFNTACLGYDENATTFNRGMLKTFCPMIGANLVKNTTGDHHGHSMVRHLAVCIQDGDGSTPY
ncbi:hypothetical protein TNCV_4650841 [Trichonephila clavipes]|nr:hypothetical protein TNCV_4650841 [Trichonephila clavipes]